MGYFLETETTKVFLVKVAPVVVSINYCISKDVAGQRLSKLSSLPDDIADQHFLLSLIID